MIEPLHKTASAQEEIFYLKQELANVREGKRLLEATCDAAIECVAALNAEVARLNGKLAEAGAAQPVPIELAFAELTDEEIERLKGLKTNIKAAVRAEQPVAPRPAMSASEHNAFPFGRWAHKQVRD